MRQTGITGQALRATCVAVLVLAGGLSACRGAADTGDSLRATLEIMEGDSGRALAPPGAPADAFPLPTRAVAEIVAPRWSNEDDRDDIGEAERVMRLINATEGMHIADIGAGDGYYVARLTERVIGRANV